MNNQKQKGSVDEQLDRILEGLPLSDDARRHIETWRAGEPLDNRNAEIGRQFVVELMRIVRASPNSDTAFEEQILGALRTARLDDWRLVFQEAVLRRIADNPQKAVELVATRDMDVSTQNTKNASSSRESRHDWWSVQIQDCLEGNIDASVEDVIRYLLATGEVEVDGKNYRHISNAAEPISRAQMRSRMKAAKKRIGRES